MAKIPVKKCSGCGKLNEITVTKCECGKELKYFFQKCPGCGTMNFTLEEESPVKVCYKCMKTRISSVARALYVTEQPKAEEEAQVVSKVITGGLGVDTKGSSNEDDEDDEDDAPMSWGKLAETVKKTGAGASSGSAAGVTSGSATSAGVSGKGAASDHGAQASITLTAINYGTFCHTVTSGETPFLLGRSANFRDFLSQDRRIGNEHCILTYENEKWHVKDNHSQNGTFLNERDLGYNGESVLADGDRIKLGHEGDSLTFQVSIN